MCALELLPNRKCDTTFRAYRTGADTVDQGSGTGRDMRGHNCPYCHPPVHHGWPASIAYIFVASSAFLKATMFAGTKLESLCFCVLSLLHGLLLKIVCEKRLRSDRVYWTQERDVRDWRICRNMNLLSSRHKIMASFLCVAEYCCGNNLWHESWEKAVCGVLRIVICAKHAISKVRMNFNAVWNAHWNQQ